MPLGSKAGGVLEVGRATDRYTDRARFLDDVARRLSGLLEGRLRRSGLMAEDAADVSQEAFARLCSYAGWREIASAEGFLWRVARNLLVDRSRVPRLRVAEAVRADTVPSLEASVEDTLAIRQEIDILRVALAELPPVCQAVFVAHRFDEKSYREIAAEFGISISMVEKHMMRALAHFRQRLGTGGTPSPVNRQEKGRAE